MPELAGLLDPATQFPAAPWTGTNLALLLPLGLRASVTGDTVLQAARYIEMLADTDEDTAYARWVLTRSLWSCDECDVPSRCL